MMRIKLADEERIRATLTGMNCIQYCEGGWTTPDPLRNGAKDEMMAPYRKGGEHLEKER